MGGSGRLQLLRTAPSPPKSTRPVSITAPSQSLIARSPDRSISVRSVPGLSLFLCDYRVLTPCSCPNHLSTINAVPPPHSWFLLSPGWSPASTSLGSLPIEQTCALLPPSSAWCVWAPPSLCHNTMCWDRRLPWCVRRQMEALRFSNHPRVQQKSIGWDASGWFSFHPEWLTLNWRYIYISYLVFHLLYHMFALALVLCNAAAPCAFNCHLGTNIHIFLIWIWIWISAGRV